MFTGLCCGTPATGLWKQRTGGEGVRLAQQHSPDAILMDLHLPYVDGWQATEILKSDPATAHIPVIAVSTHVQHWDRERATAAGCASFLAKPCEPTRVVEEIRRILPEALVVLFASA